MIGGSLLRAAVYGVVGLFVLSTLFGAFLGQPVGLTYVETESMAPTLDPGDGFITVPMALAGPIEEGDVIVFDAVELHGGGLVTHRVVGQGDSGYLTRGDANPVIDQDGGEPPVQDAQIKGKALEVGGTLVVIPRIGLLVIGIQGVLVGFQQFLAVTFGTRAFLGSQGLVYILAGFGVFVYIAAGLTERRRRPERRASRQRDALSGGLVVVGLTALLVIAITMSMLIPAGAQNFQFVSSESSSDSSGVIERGTSKDVTYAVPSHGAFPVVAILEPTTDGITVSDTHLHIPGGSSANVTVTIQAPPETGVYTESLTEYRYIALLPTDTIVSLHTIHPWAPVVVIDVIVGGVVMVVAFSLVGTDPIRLNRRRDALPLRVRIRRWLR